MMKLKIYKCIIGFVIILMIFILVYNVSKVIVGTGDALDKYNEDGGASYECTDESVKAIKQMYSEMAVVSKEINILKEQIKTLEEELQTQSVLCSGAFVENTLRNIMKEKDYAVEESRD